MSLDFKGLKLWCHAGVSNSENRCVTQKQVLQEVRALSGESAIMPQKCIIFKGKKT